MAAHDKSWRPATDPVRPQFAKAAIPGSILVAFPVGLQRVYAGIVLALSERTALGSLSCLDANGIARKPARPLSTQPCRPG
jgi:hypothetical protein